MFSDFHGFMVKSVLQRKRHKITLYYIKLIYPTQLKLYTGHNR